MLIDNQAAIRFVDPEPVRAHIHTLRDAGMSPTAIAAFAGCHEAAIIRISDSNGSLATPVHRETAERILLIPVEITAMPTIAQLPSQGARRRLQALGAMGWSVELLSAESGIPARSLEALLTAPLISMNMERDVNELFSRLWDKPAPERTIDEQLLKICTIEHARTQGWVTALAWDDIDQDEAPAPTPRHDPRLIDEVAVHLAMTGQLVKLNRHERDHAVRRLRAQGYTIEEVADRLRTSVATVARAGKDDPTEQAA